MDHLGGTPPVGTGAVLERNTEIGYDVALDASGNVYLSEPHLVV
jgi:hypothetical protein